MSNYTTFQVIKIINEYSLVINGGLNHSISLHDDIEIFVIGDDVVDLYNDNKSLGTLDFIKETLRVTEIYREFAVCKKIVEEEVYQRTAVEMAFSQFGSVGKTVTKEYIKELRINPSEVTGRKTADKTIVIGDTARIALSS